MTQVLINKPQNFNVGLVSCACHLEWNNHLLFLKKAEGRWSNNLWGIPCGTVENNEDLFKTMIRELYEETGIQIEKENLKYIAPLYITQPGGFDYVFNMFYSALDTKADIKISNEHSSYAWVTKENIKNYELIPGQLDALLYFWEIMRMSKGSKFQK